MTQKRFFEGKGEPEFILSRGWKLDRLDQIELPKMKKVSIAAMKALLFAIDDRCGKLARKGIKMRTLCRRTGLKEAQLRRTRAALVSLGVLFRERRSDGYKAHANVYEIQWKAVDARCPESTWPAGGLESDLVAGDKTSECASRRESDPTDHGDRLEGGVQPIMVIGPTDHGERPTDHGDRNLVRFLDPLKDPPPPTSSNRISHLPEAQAAFGGVVVEKNFGSEEGKDGREVSQLPQAQSGDAAPLVRPGDLADRAAVQRTFERLAVDPRVDLAPGDGDRRLFYALVFDLNREVGAKRGTKEAIRNPYLVLESRLLRGKAAWVPWLTDFAKDRAAKAVVAAGTRSASQ